MSEYTYTDPYGSRLHAGTSGRHGADVYLDAEVSIPAADLPEVVAGLYRAAGQVPPILVPRYEAEPGMTRNGKVRAGIRPSGEDMRPADAMDIASWYATAAQEAIAEALSQPDPAQVAALAEVIRDLAERDVLTTEDDGEAVARAILAAGYARTEEKA